MVKPPKNNPKFVERNPNPRLQLRYENSDLEIKGFSSYWSEIYDSDDYRAFLEDAREYRSNDDILLVRELQKKHGLTDRVAGEFTNFFFLNLMELRKAEIDTSDPDVLEFMTIKSFLAMEENRIETRRSRNIDLIVLRELEQKIRQQKTQRRVAEGVTNERSDPMSEESKLDNAELAPIFEGELNRDAMANALEAAMQEQGLSIRKAAETVGIDKKEIQRVGKGTATLDRSADVLSGLGYELHIEVRKIDKS